MPIQGDFDNEFPYYALGTSRVKQHGLGVSGKVNINFPNDYNFLTASQLEVKTGMVLNGNLQHVAGTIESSNFVTGVSGYQLDAGTGAIEAWSLTLSGGTLSIGTSPNWFRVDSSGNIWTGHANFASAPFKVANSGMLTSTDIDVYGNVVLQTLGGFQTSPSAPYLKMINTTARHIDSPSGDGAETSAGAITWDEVNNADRLHLVAAELGTAGGADLAAIDVFGRTTSLSGYINFTADDINVLLSSGGRLKVQGGPIQAVDGSVGAPAYSFTSDTNTGIYRTGTDAIGISLGGVWRALFQASNTFFCEAAGSVYMRNTTDGAIVMRETSATSGYTKYLRIEGSDGGIDGLVGMVSGDMRIQGYSGVDVQFWAGGAAAWQINNTTGDLRPAVSGGSDLGTSTYTVGTIHANLTDSTANANAMNRNSSTGRLQYDSSTIRNKRKLQEWKPELGYVDALSKLRLVSYLKGEDSRVPGLIAEDVHETLGEYATVRDAEGEIFNYRDRALLVALVGAVGELQQQLEEQV